MLQRHLYCPKYFNLVCSLPAHCYLYLKYVSISRNKYLFMLFKSSFHLSKQCPFYWKDLVKNHTVDSIIACCGFLFFFFVFQALFQFWRAPKSFLGTQQRLQLYKLVNISFIYLFTSSIFIRMSALSACKYVHHMCARCQKKSLIS